MINLQLLVLCIVAIGTQLSPEVSCAWFSVSGCFPDNTTCSNFDGEFGEASAKYTTVRKFFCDDQDDFKLTCVKWDDVGCITTDCIPKSTLKNKAKCEHVTARDSSSTGKYAHKVNAFEELCTSGNKERIVCCQSHSVESLLLAGYGAEPHEFPHQALIIMREGTELNRCGGTIYNEKWILTAAHCVVNEINHPTHKYKNPSKQRLKYSVPAEPEQVEVIVGTNIPNTAPGSHHHKVERIIVHKDYERLLRNQNRLIRINNEEADKLGSDIALLELEGNGINLNDQKGFTKALRIAPPHFNPKSYSEKLVIVGWGTTDNSETSNFLQKGDVPIRDDGSRECKYKGYNASMHLCVGGFVNGVYGKSAGSGDSGGPGICRDEMGQPVLCGIASFNSQQEDCIADPGKCQPSGYTEVSFFHNWILKRTGGGQDTGRTKFMNAPLYGKEVPYDLSQVRITTSVGKSCGGTLVAEDIIVTAAHCVFERVNGVVRSKLGIKVFFKSTEYRIKYADKILPVGGNQMLVTSNKDFHKRFRNYKYVALPEDLYYESDVAVLKLNSAITEAQPSVISSTPLAEYQGNVREFSFMRNPKRDLRKFPVKILDKENCEGRYRRLFQNKVDFTLSSTDVCMAEKFSGGSTCDRDVGGGVFCGKKLCGVQVFRMCDFSTPRIVTDTSFLKDEIQDHAENNNLDYT